MERQVIEWQVSRVTTGWQDSCSEPILGSLGTKAVNLPH